MSEMDLEAVVRRIRHLAKLDGNDSEQEQALAECLADQALDIADALERAAEVAGQGCEFCEHAVDDLGEERNGGRESHAHWWACGRCWNESAQRTSMAIGHFSDLLDRALERIPELERRLDEAVDQNMRQASRLERAERVASAVHFLLYETGSEDEQGVALTALGQLVPPLAALAPASDGSDGE